MPDSKHWAEFDPEWILWEDKFLIFVNKPVGVPSQESLPGAKDDLANRVRSFLSAREGRPFGKLGSHERLSQEISGVQLFAKDKTVNADLAKQFESSEVTREFVALTPQAPPKRKTLTDHLRRVGAKNVVTHKGKGAKRTVTRLMGARPVGKVFATTVQIEHSRLHALRAQLAHVKSPVLGDEVYGGPSASRLMLHASALTVRHPKTGAPIRVPAPLPTMMRNQADVGQDADVTREALYNAAYRRVALHAEPSLTAFRLFQATFDGCPGFDVDVYERHALVHIRDSSIDEAMVVKEVHAMGFDGVYIKRRPKQANLVKSDDAELAPAAAMLGTNSVDLSILEHGVRFPVTLGGTLSTGIFLDQRLNRQRLQKESAEKRVLNLFSYSCGFSVAAALGKAAEVCSVDLSGAAINAGKNLFEANGLDPSDFRFMKADAFETLRRFAKDKALFDVVVVDPPTYATHKRGRWNSGKQWVELTADVFQVCAAKALVLMSSNDKRMNPDAFRKYIHEGARRAGRSVAKMHDGKRGIDYPDSAGVKHVWVRLTD